MQIKELTGYDSRLDDSSTCTCHHTSDEVINWVSGSRDVYYSLFRDEWCASFFHPRSNRLFQGAICHSCSARGKGIKWRRFPCGGTREYWTRGVERPGRWSVKKRVSATEKKRLFTVDLFLPGMYLFVFRHYTVIGVLSKFGQFVFWRWPGSNVGW